MYRIYKWQFTETPFRRRKRYFSASRENIYCGTFGHWNSRLNGLFLACSLYSNSLSSCRHNTTLYIIAVWARLRSDRLKWLSRIKVFVIPSPSLNAIKNGMAWDQEKILPHLVRKHRYCFGTLECGTLRCMSWRQDRLQAFCLPVVELFSWTRFVINTASHL